MGTKKRASLHLVQGREQLREHDPGGLEIFDAELVSFRAALTRENHTLKRTLTDPYVFSGIGNAYSDEILHRAKLSPIKQTKQLSDDEIVSLFQATRECMQEWIERLRKDTGNEFPERVTAFRDDMAVHGKYRKPCPVCGAPVQRIVYAENETNYCAKCQTGGKLLADRSCHACSKTIGRGLWRRWRRGESFPRLQRQHPFLILPRCGCTSSTMSYVLACVHTKISAGQGCGEV